MRADALLIVDVQNDFLPGGALGVHGGDAIVPLANALCADFVKAGRPVVFTRDWHPPDHCSFREQGGPWPVHCVAGSRGAEFAPGLEIPAGAIIVSKATRRDAEAYSTFAGTGLTESLRALGVTRIVLAGLATDYCVRASSLDALAAGFEVTVVEDAVRAVDVTPGDGARALEEIRRRGARTVSSKDLAAVRP
jgi:nicotinamidase/pyrazinamidase